jgi:23S rRNA (adenine2503-C2)-methyltransferase
LTGVLPAARLPEEWQEELSALGQPRYRAIQVFRWIHQKGELDPSRMTDLPAELRSALAERGLRPEAEALGIERAPDGTRKLLVGFPDGGRVECVVIPMTRLGTDDADVSAGDDDDEEEGDVPTGPTRVTLCISTQIGCAMGCVFCASGRAGLKRGLEAGEIVSQVLLAKRELSPGEQLKNLVFMGMGEPLHHYDETARALRLLTHPDGGGMSPRRITVSTVGLVPALKRLGEDFGGKVGLAVSLHAPDDRTRESIVPMNRRYPVAELVQALRDYPLPRRRRITIEYTLIDGVNDGDSHADELARLLRGIPVKVNVIPMNPVEGSPLKASPPGRVQRFQAKLTRAGYSCFVRTRRGSAVNAACGQLALAPELVELRRKSARMPS